jgi:hypothetical protein
MYVCFESEIEGVLQINKTSWINSTVLSEICSNTCIGKHLTSRLSIKNGLKREDNIFWNVAKDNNKSN